MAKRTDAGGERKHETRWERERTAWYREAARTTIRDEASWLFWFLGFGSLALLLNGWELRDTTVGRLCLAGGAVAALLFWALWTGRPWSRLLGGGLAVLFTAFGVIGLLGPGERSGLAWTWSAFLTLIWLGTASFLLSARAGRLFEQARRGPPEAG